MPFLHVIIIDDEQAELESIEKIFDVHLPEIITLTTLSGEEALKHAKNILYDMVFLDVDMPDMDGVETYKELQKIRGYNTVPIIFMISTESDMTYVEDTLKLKGVEHIVKPIDPYVLTKKIETCKAIVKEWIKLRNLSDLEKNLNGMKGI